MIEQVVSGRHPMHDELENLRAESLRWIAGAVVFANLGLFYYEVGNPEIGDPRSAMFKLLAPLAVVGLAGTAWGLAGRTCAGAVGALLASMLGSVAVAVVIYTARQALFVLPLVVFAAPLLVSYRQTCLMAVVTSLVLWVLAHFTAVPLSNLDVVAVLLLIIGSTGLAWVAYRPIRVMLGWAWENYRSELRKTQELRERQAELSRLSKSLVETCERLEQANAALTQARLAAEDARRMKDEFATAISHELRTPLNLIIGFSEMIVSDTVEGDGETLAAFRGDVEAIYRNACHLSDLVDDVLVLGQLDAQRLSLQKEWSAVPRIVEEAAKAVAGLYSKAGLSLNVDLPPDLPPVYVDPTRIRQVLINLLTNAVRYTDEGGVRVLAHQDGQEVVVSVTDTGVGIPPEDLPYVFERYRQTGQPHRRAGFGLGLTVSKRFVELHAGTMTVSSEPGRGTTFSFSLPAIDNVAALATRPDWSLLESPHLGDRPERVVLVLDRDVEAARIFQRQLDGYHFAVATTPGEAARLAQGGRVAAVVITDPGISTDGDLAQAALRHLPGVPSLRCPLRTVGRLGQELGAVAFLTKPVTMERIHEALHRLGLRPRRALVVDDDAAVVTLLSRMLRRTAPRCRVQAATSVDQGLALARAERPDLVLLDLLMPGRNGYDFLRVWRDEPSLRAIPVVIVSAASEECQVLVVGKCLEVGRHGGLSLTDLMHAVRGSLDGLLATNPGIN